ncbi:MAG: Vinylacetyl-CoA Delta-isomerase [Frankiales bacterium]|nr:Vinylacetyl-CoA Delta-isomerase [Frankiales bacterium]
MLTGDEYRESLRDGRRVFMDGVRIEDVTVHPLLRSSVDWTASSYDKYYDPDPEASGPYFFIPKSIDDLRAQGERQIDWDYPTGATSQGLLMVLTAASRMRATHPVYADRALAYFNESRLRDIRCVETITDAKGNRSLPPGKQDDPDMYLRIVERSADGIVIRGAKLHITGAAISHEMLVMPTKRMKAGEEDWSVACAVPVNAPGVTILTTSTAPRPDLDPSLFPYSSRYNTGEGFIVFDDVFVPNERVFLAGEVEHSATFAHALGLWQRLGSIGSYVKLADTLVGLAQLTAEANGLERVPHIREKIADMITYATLIRAGYEAAIQNADYTEEGWAGPDELFTNAAKFYAAAEFSHIVRHLHDIAGGSVLTAPSLRDLANPETGPYIEKYMRTMEGVDADLRLRLFHAIRDFTADAYGGWQHVTMIQSGGGLFAQRLVVHKHYDMDHAKELAKHVAGISKDETEDGTESIVGARPPFG